MAFDLYAQTCADNHTRHKKKKKYSKAYVNLHGLSKQTAKFHWVDLHVSVYGVGLRSLSFICRDKVS